MDTYLPPKYSLNSFFVRHVAHPRRMKYISGLGNAKICSVNDVGYINHQTGTHSSISNNFLQRTDFPPNNYNEDLLKSESLLFKRRERAVPPNGMWNTFGLIDNTEKWRTQLNSLASAVGLLTQNDLEEMRRKKERDDMIKNFQFKTPKLPPSSSGSRAQSAVAKIKSPTARLNEPLPSRNRTSRNSRGNSAATGHKSSSFNSKHYVIDSADREIWMLQVLCQILQTDNLTDVQSWLVSTSDSEKERVKQLIDQAMRGLEESGRITEQNSNISIPIDQTPKTNYNQANNTNNEQTENRNQSSLAYIENALQKIDLSKPQLAHKPSKTKYNNQNILKLDESTDNLPNRLEPIPELRANNTDFYDTNDDQNLGGGGGGEKSNLQEDLTTNSAIYNINMHATQTNNKNLLEKAIVKLETPTPIKDYRVEQVKVTMLVKDQQSNAIKLTGDWKST